MAVSDKEIYELVRELVVEVRENHEDTIKKISKMDEKLDKVIRRLEGMDKLTIKTNEIVNGLAKVA